MSDIIRLLPDGIANQIAAGEVIQRPASVVKELVENAVDAGATTIRVYVRDAGKALIMVVDDGRGMSAADAQMAFERHATSKIATAEDLFSLSTMGFRGEALASIAAVAQVELRTRRSEDELGVRILVAASEVVEVTADSCDHGSSFSVRNLFYNIPARRKFLKTNDVEYRHIMHEFERIALVNPQLVMEMYRDDAEAIVLSRANLRQRITGMFGKRLNTTLLPLETRTSMIYISGYTGRPDATRKKGYLQYFFVNGRYMRHSYFHKAVLSAYEHLISADGLPDYFIYFSVDPATIDVNIHPAKTEIKFENEAFVWQILQSAVREALGKSGSTPSIDFDRDGSVDIPVYGYGSPREATVPTIQYDKNYNPFNETRCEEAFREEAFSCDRVSESPLAYERTSQGGCRQETTEDLPQANLAAHIQYGGKYIVTTLKSGLAVIDQRRAHVAILYERYLNSIRQHKGISHKVLFPEIIELSAAEETAFIPLLDTLSKAGFDLSSLGNQAYAINGIPAGMEKQNPISLLRNILAQATDTGSSSPVEDLAAIIASSLARSAAITYGKILTEAEMSAMIAALFSIPSHRRTPSGKTVMHIIPNGDMEKLFQ